MEKRFTCSVLLALTVLCTSLTTNAKDNFGFPELKVGSTASELKVSFADPAIWDGKNIVSEMRCTRLGGKGPVSPVLNIESVPEGATSLIVFYANPAARDNHGLIRFRKNKDVNGWQIPAIRSQASDKLPKGIELFDGGNLAGKAYAAPCPTGGNWQYTVTVYALNESDNVLAVGKLVLGWVSP